MPVIDNIKKYRLLLDFCNKNGCTFYSIQKYLRNKKKDYLWDIIVHMKLKTEGFCTSGKENLVVMILNELAKLEVTTIPNV